MLTLLTYVRQGTNLVALFSDVILFSRDKKVKNYLAEANNG